MVSWCFSQIFQISYFKEHLLMAASEIIWKSCVIAFVQRSSRPEVVDNCSEKSEKNPKKSSVEVHFFVLVNKKQSPNNAFLDIFRVIICWDCPSAY